MSRFFILIFFLFISSFVHATPAEDWEQFNRKNHCRGCGFAGKVFSKDTLSSILHINASLQEAYLLDTVWQGINLQGASLHNTHSDNIRFENCFLRLTNLSYSDLPYLKMESSNYLEGVNFIGSGLEFSDFREVTLDRPYFDSADLTEVNFSHAVIIKGSFIKTWLQDTNFSYAVLQDANFSNAKMKRVDFRYADLRGAKLSEAQLASSILCDTILPDGNIYPCKK